MPGQKEGFVKVWRLRVLFRCKKNNLCGLEACCCSRLHVGFSNKHPKRRDSDKQSDKNNCNHSLPRLITTRKMNSHKTCLCSKAWTPLTVKQGNTWLTKQKQVETQCCWADLLTAAAAKATAPAFFPPIWKWTTCFKLEESGMTRTLFSADMQFELYSYPAMVTAKWNTARQFCPPLQLSATGGLPDGR